MKRLMLATVVVQALMAQSTATKKASVTPQTRVSEIPALRQQGAYLQAEITKIQKRLDAAEKLGWENTGSIYGIKKELVELDPGLSRLLPGYILRAAWANGG